MSMMSLLTKSYLKTSFLAYEKLVLLYLMYIQKQQQLQQRNITF